MAEDDIKSGSGESLLSLRGGRPVRLTAPRRRTLLEYLRREREREVAPTFRDLCDLHGWVEVSTARDHIYSLGRLGILAKEPCFHDPREVRRVEAWKLTPAGRDLAKTIHDALRATRD